MRRRRRRAPADDERQAGEEMRGDERTASEVSAARENGPVFAELTDRLLARGLEPDERAHLLALWRRLRDAVDRDARAAVVRRLLELPDPPGDLLLAAAEDDPEIAAPLLKEAPFGADELIALIARTGPAHHIEIAKRADLTLDVWLALARAATARGRREKAEEDAEPDRRPVAVSRPAAPPSAGKASADASPARTQEGGSEDARSSADRPLGAGPPRPADDGWQLLDDPAGDAWAFQTDRRGVVTGLSPLAETAFGRPLDALAGRSFVDLVADHAAAPGPDWIGEAMRARRPIRDAVVELAPADGAPARRWRIRAKPRFSFPDGRFLGYAGTARDLDRVMAPAARSIPELLERMADAADRLARSTEDPRLEDYARTLGELARSLKLAVAGGRGAGAHLHDR